METVSEIAVREFLKRNQRNDIIYNDCSNGEGIIGCGFGEGKAEGSGSLEGIHYNKYFAGSNSLSGLIEYNGHNVYQLRESSESRDIAIIFYSLEDNLAEVGIIQQDFTVKGAYVYKVGNAFGVGNTEEEAKEKAHRIAVKWECENCVDDYIQYTLDNFPDVDALYTVESLTKLHNVITGSCKSGIREFLENNNLKPDDKVTLREFFNICRYQYGSGDIMKVASKYGMEL